MTAYLVQLEKPLYLVLNSEEGLDNQYKNELDVMIVTNDPKKIFEFFGEQNIVRVEKLGIGYTL